MSETASNMFKPQHVNNSFCSAVNAVLYTNYLDGDNKLLIYLYSLQLLELKLVVYIH